MSDLRTAAQQALEALEGVITDLRAAKAESDRDWSLLEATQESLREHMAEVQRLRAALAQPATIAEWWAAKQAASGEPDMRHPKIQALIGGKARREIELRLVEQLLDDPDCDLSAMDMEYWHGLHDKLREKLTAAPAQPAPARAPSSVNPEAHADFVRALHGGKGDLDAWLECYDETEVRAHVLALVHQPAASGEPVAWWIPKAEQFCITKPGERPFARAWQPLYAAPQPAPARVPLTDEQTMATLIARAIEATHGITTKEAP